MCATDRVRLVITFVAVGVLRAGAAAQVPEDAQSLCLPTGPPPTGGYEPYLGGVSQRGVVVISGVPAYLWHHGCGPTAAGMVIGYWDWYGFYQLIPGDASTQTPWVDEAIASTGHYQDYSLPLDYAPDPIQPDRSEPPPGDEHPSDSLGDFMNTSWSSRSNYYGWSWYSDVDNALLGYTSYANNAYGAAYTATAWNEAWGTFTWADFVAEINAYRPMVFLVDSNGDGATDHFVTAIGYRDIYGYQEYACLDTWATGVRWERFRAMSPSYAWGIYGATFYHIQAPTGACCLADGSCQEVSETECAGLCGTYQGDNTACTPGLCPHIGDLNCDGIVDFGDINPFVQFLCNYPQWLADFAGCNPLNGDINGDGTYGQSSFGDINPFVVLLTGG
jgi:hypothetical protein